ncbi:hypothetical protein CYMTET_43381, partial [Cymbomonas tetramitiformis]
MNVLKSHASRCKKNPKNDAKASKSDSSPQSAAPVSKTKSKQACSNSQQTRPGDPASKQDSPLQGTAPLPKKGQDSKLAPAGGRAVGKSSGSGAPPAKCRKPGASPAAVGNHSKTSSQVARTTPVAPAGSTGKLTDSPSKAIHEETATATASKNQSPKVLRSNFFLDDDSTSEEDEGYVPDFLVPRAQPVPSTSCRLPETGGSPEKLTEPEQAGGRRGAEAHGGAEKGRAEGLEQAGGRRGAEAHGEAEKGRAEGLEQGTEGKRKRAEVAHPSAASAARRPPRKSPGHIPPSGASGASRLWRQLNEMAESAGTSDARASQPAATASLEALPPSPLGHGASDAEPAPATHVDPSPRAPKAPALPSAAPQVANPHGPLTIPKKKRPPEAVAVGLGKSKFGPRGGVGAHKRLARRGDVLSALLPEPGRPKASAKARWKSEASMADRDGRGSPERSAGPLAGLPRDDAPPPPVLEVVPPPAELGPPAVDDEGPPSEDASWGLPEAGDAGMSLEARGKGSEECAAQGGGGDAPGPGQEVEVWDPSGEARQARAAPGMSWHREQGGVHRERAAGAPQGALPGPGQPGAGEAARLPDGDSVTLVRRRRRMVIIDDECWNITDRQAAGSDPQEKKAVRGREG